ncbi:MAG: hypothetical protein ACKV22_14930 [Bryobacteraceae bacterium]
MTTTRRAFLAGAATTRLTTGQGIRPDPDGMIVVNGKRTFLHGLYQLPNGTDRWQMAQDAGFQFTSTGANVANLDLARKHGMYGWAGVGSISPQKRTEDEERIRKVVNEVKSHPALLFWETEDEPSYQWKKPGPRVPPAVIKDTYRFLKQLDPGHPVYLNHSPTNLVSTLQEYNPGGDILGTDIYPVIPHGIRETYALWPDGRQGDFLNPYISQVGPYADKLRQVAGRSRAIFMVLQAFAWEKLREKDQDPKLVLYPTQAQLRFMACQSIVHGANGLLWWGLGYTPADAPFWSDLAAVTKDLRTLDRELAAAPTKLPLRLEYHDTGHSLDRGIEWIAKPSGSGAMLIAVNADSNPVDVTLRGLDRFGKVSALFESRGLAVKHGALRDQYEPFGVHAYRLG